MDVIATTLEGLWKIRPHAERDARGWFARTYDGETFAAHGLVTTWPQHGEAFNAAAGTVRGLHFQREPHAETKLIRCTRGAAYHVLLDARPPSPTYGRWEAFALSEDDPTALYAPAGFAHGYQTLHDATVLHYLISTPYVAEAAGGFRYDGLEPEIPWPLPVTVISDRDRALPPFVTSRIDA